MASKPSAIDDLLDIFDGSNLSNTQILLPTTQQQQQKQSATVEPANIKGSLNLSNVSSKISETESIYETIKAEDLKKKSLIQEADNTSLIEQNQINPEPVVHTIHSATNATTTAATNKLNFLNSPTQLEHFLNEVQKLENHINSLSNKTLSSLTLLEKEWKELNDYQEKQSIGMTISVARCYPNKNRFQDLLPYDQTRVILQNKNDDYINATNIGKLIISEIIDTTKLIQQKQPSFIVAQVVLNLFKTDFFVFLFNSFYLRPPF